MKALAVSLPRFEWVYHGVPFLLALLVHMLAALALMDGWGNVREPERILFRESVSATLIEIEAAVPEPAPVTRPPPRQEPPAQRQPAPQAPLPTEVAPARPDPTPPRIATPEPAPAPEPRPDTRWQEELAETFSRAVDAEADRLATRQADAATASYIGAIIRQIERQWSRPPSARRGMQTELLINLVPTGELVNITTVRSSGNEAFDRSAELAVRQAAPFRVPEDSALFEQRFRQLRLLFTPEDLRNR